MRYAHNTTSEASSRANGALVNGITTTIHSAASHDSTSNQRPKTPSRFWLNGVRRPKTSPSPRSSPFKARSQHLHDDPRRDSGVPSTPNTTKTSITAESEGGLDLQRAPSLPTIIVQDDSARGGPNGGRQEGEAPLQLADPPCQEEAESFRGITTDIPTGSFEDLSSPDKIQFSNRGSMLLGGKKANTAFSHMGLLPEIPGRSGARTPPEDSTEARSKVPANGPSTPRRAVSAQGETSQVSDEGRLRVRRGQHPGARVLSADEMMLSKKVRSMYENGGERARDWDITEQDAWKADDVPVEDRSMTDSPNVDNMLHVEKTRQREGARSPSLMQSRPSSMLVKEPFETAGGIEDWEDVEGGDVDRYGFIVPRKVHSRGSSEHPPSPPERPHLQRVSTALKMVSETPRRRRTLRRTASTARSTRSAKASAAPKRKPSLRSLKPPGSLYSYQSTSTVYSQNPFRYATNRLPYNRERRWVDEASDMLTLPPGLADIAEQEEGGRAELEMKQKEWEREEKWRKMAKVIRREETGGGMLFDFDTRDPKVIARTWKGIPDKWRSTAWHAFLSASATKDGESLSDEELVEIFYELQDQDSADDVQIDVDVPRTISHHIMFRRRYRGGQRLLFRVLHAISLHLPETGYVQGMAALAATLLCYYDEEKAFVMLVRLWQLRGLERLYQPGFGGLMEALEDFEKNWLAGGEVATKLEELNISSTAYGTRWYLTLFNYSIPFPAQLRVWDVFMLLGDSAHSITPTGSTSGNLDILHATSAALLAAEREILIDSDFDNVMKVLTSWIPIKDEDILMRVAKAEWKQRKKRARGTAAATKMSSSL